MLRLDPHTHTPVLSCVVTAVLSHATPTKWGNKMSQCDPESTEENHVIAPDGDTLLLPHHSTYSQAQCYTVNWRPSLDCPWGDTYEGLYTSALD